jgi:hypothetical protein
MEEDIIIASERAIQRLLSEKVACSDYFDR